MFLCMYVCMFLFYVLGYVTPIRLRLEGDVKVLKVFGDAVLPYFWCGFAEIFILTCGISVLLHHAVCGFKNV